MPVQKENFFHSLKVECLQGERFVSRELVRMAVFNISIVITIAGLVTLPVAISVVAQ